MDGRRVTAYGSMLGVAFGGFTWVVVAGGLIHEPVVSLGGVALGSLVWWFGGRGLLRYPTRPAMVWGVLTLLVEIGRASCRERGVRWGGVAVWSDRREMVEG